MPHTVTSTGVLRDQSPGYADAADRYEVIVSGGVDTLTIKDAS